MAKELFLCKHVNTLTRRGNVPGLILSAKQHMTNVVAVVESLGSGNHSAIEYSVITQVNLMESEESSPEFRRANFEALMCDFYATECREIF